MHISKTILIACFGITAIVILFGQNTREYSDGDYRQAEYIEVSSVLWKAHIYDSEIQFLSGNRVIRTVHFDYSDGHINSVSYRNLNGYFDPILVTVWQRGQTFKALILDPLREQYLLEIETKSEIDISISPENRILLTYEELEKTDAVELEDQIITWPL